MEIFINEPKHSRSLFTYYLPNYKFKLIVNTESKYELIELLYNPLKSWYYLDGMKKIFQSDAFIEYIIEPEIPYVLTFCKYYSYGKEFSVEYYFEDIDIYTIGIMLKMLLIKKYIKTYKFENKYYFNNSINYIKHLLVGTNYRAINSII